MKTPLTDQSGEVRELTDDDFSKAKPASEVLGSIIGDNVAGQLLHRKRGERGKQKTPVKRAVYIRFSPEVVKYFKATGAGWQTRIDDALKDYIREH